MRRDPRRRPRPGNNWYFAEARQEDCTLLEIDERKFDVPSARDGVFGMGQSNIRYTDEPQAEPFVRSLREYIEGYCTGKEPVMPLNTILYGPPGTGKTWATARRCVEICDGPAERLDKEIRDRYRKLLEQGRVEFITFHQSYGYEEFVEGLRPVTGGDEEENGDGSPGFRLVATDGVLKRIAERARKVASSTETSFDFDGRRIFKISLVPRDTGDVFDECIKDGCVLLGYGGDVDWSEDRFDDPREILERWREHNPHANGHDSHVKTMKRFRAEMKEGDLVIVPKGVDRFRAVGEVAGRYQFVPRDDDDYRPSHRRAVRWHWHDAGEGRPISEIYDKILSRLTIYELDRRTVRIERLQSYLGHFEGSERPLPHVLVIDEINRANVSKVMGELVTLLEEDKREGGANEVAVTLPHSRKPFTLPANLHLLGTMNTADRSIALLDTALRRRFDFEELPPDPEKLLHADIDLPGTDLPAVLRAMNERLEWLVDRDHLIGHAWLMGARTREDVDRIMRRRIIPLVGEYFYDDWEKVRAVLGGGEDFVQREELRPPPGLDDPGEARYRWTVREPPYEAEAYARLVSGAPAATTGAGQSPAA